MDESNKTTKRDTLVSVTLFEIARILIAALLVFFYYSLVTYIFWNNVVVDFIAATHPMTVKQCLSCGVAISVFLEALGSLAKLTAPVTHVHCAEKSAEERVLWKPTGL
jgi:hypothetical protein